MRTIYKYPIDKKVLFPYKKVFLPKSAQIVKVSKDYNNEDCIWAIVDPSEQETEERYFVIAATGEFWDENQVKYIGTYFDRGYVWHLLEVIEWEDEEKA